MESQRKWLQRRAGTKSGCHFKEMSPLQGDEQNGCREGQGPTPVVHFTEVSALKRVKEND